MPVTTPAATCGRYAPPNPSSATMVNVVAPTATKVLVFRHRPSFGRAVCASIQARSDAGGDPFKTLLALEHRWKSLWIRSTDRASPLPLRSSPTGSPTSNANVDHSSRTSRMAFSIFTIRAAGILPAGPVGWNLAGSNERI